MELPANIDLERVEWEQALDLLRAQGWRVELASHYSLVQLSGHVPDGEPFYLRGKYDLIELDIGGDDPVGAGYWQYEMAYEDAGYLKGPEAVPIIQQMHSQYLADLANAVGKWCLRGETTPVTGTEAADLVEQRLEELSLTTWFDHADGWALRVATNGNRAMVTLSNAPNAGHAIDNQATGSQGGYALENGLRGTYDNRDTVRLGTAYVVLIHIIDYGRPPVGVAWAPE